MDFLPSAINIHQQVVGSLPTIQAFGMRMGRVWENGQMYRPDDLVVHPSDYGPDLNDINDAGRVAGSASTGTFMAHAAWWQAGQATPHDAGSLRAISQGVGINAAGDLVAATDDQIGGTQRIQLSPGGSSPRQVGPNDRNLEPCGISDTGAILAHDIDGATGSLVLFANPDAAPTPLTGLSFIGCGPNYSPTAHLISPAGAVVGSDAQGNVILRDTAGTLHNLTAGKPANTSYRPSSIVGDVVVGQRTTGSTQAAVAWLDGEWVDLNRFAPTGTTLTLATDVNPNGDIVGIGKLGTSEVGFLLKTGEPPPPPPSATAQPPATVPHYSYPPLPPAADPSTRLIGMRSLGPGVGPRVYVTRGGTTYLAGPDATFEKGDRIRTDENTILTLEFLIGGRVSINRNTEVEIVNDRSADPKVGWLKLIQNVGDTVIDMSSAVIRFPFGAPLWDLQIQTNGGTSGIKG